MTMRGVGEEGIGGIGLFEGVGGMAVNARLNVLGG